MSAPEPGRGWGWGLLLLPLWLARHNVLARKVALYVSIQAGRGEDDKEDKKEQPAAEKKKDEASKQKEEEVGAWPCPARAPVN